MRDSVGRVVDLLLVPATLIIGLYVAVSTMIMIIRCWRPVPIEDSWDELISGRHVTWSWLMSQHNEHRLLFSRVASIADYWLSAETNVFNFAVGIIMLVGLGLLVVYLFRGAGSGGWIGTIWAPGLTLALLFWSVQYETLTWGLPFVQFVGVLLIAAAAFSMLALWPPRIGILAIVIVLEFVAAYVMASGVIVAFVAVALAIWLDRPRYHVAVLSVAAVSVVVAYLVGFHSDDPDPLYALSHPESTLAYMAAYLGGPFGTSIGWLFRIDPVAVAIVAGGIGIVTFAVLACRLSRRRSDSSHKAILFALASFIVAESLVTSFGRVRLGAEQALSSRYGTHAVLFWLLLGLLSACGSFASRRKLAVMTLAFPALLVVAISEPHFTLIERDMVAERDAATPALLADVADPLLSNLYPDPSIPLQLRPLLLSARTSVFSESWASWIGTPLADHAVFADAHLCHGSFDKAVEIIDPTHPGWRAVGRAWYAARERAPRRIVLVDGVGLVNGYGLGGLGRDPKAVGASAPETAAHTRWVGAFTGGEPRSVTAYALLDETSTACSLGTVREIHHLTRPVLSNTRPADLSAGGYVDSVIISRKEISLTGWGMLQSEDGQVVIDTNLPVRRSALRSYSRPDVVAVMGDRRLANAGIAMRLDLDASVPLPDKVKLCLWSDDPAFGRHLLAIPSQPWLCPANGQ